MSQPKGAKAKRSSDVFEMSIEQLREEYEAVMGCIAADNGYYNKPTIKAVLLLGKAGIPPNLHAQILDQVTGFCSMQLEHLRSYVFQWCKIPVASLTHQQLAVAAARRAGQKAAKK